MRRGFTLIELTIVILIMAILVALGVSVYAAALNQSKIQRTQAIVAKIDGIIMEKWEGYRTRPVPIRVAPGTTPANAAAIRLLAMRELQRIELPDRITDVTAGPAYGFPPDSIPQPGYPVIPYVALSARPAINKQHLRRAFKARDTAGNVGLQYWTTANENAECLYLILASTRDGDKNALDWFSPSEIGDVDSDGMNEILDSWGQPIAFLRWPAGYRNDWVPYPVTTQSGADLDQFDPLKVDARHRDADLTNDPIALRPLVWSAGPDKKHDVNVGGGFLYATTSPANDPYVNGGVIGIPSDTNTDSDLSYADNITNHDLEAR